MCQQTRALLAHAQSAGSGPPLARFVRTSHSSASGVHDESPESIPARTPTSPLHLRPACATLRRNRDKPSVLFRTFVFDVADVPAADAVPVSVSRSAERFVRRTPSHYPGWARWFVRVADLPAAVAVVRSPAVASPTCARTASAGAGSAAASEFSISLSRSSNCCSRWSNCWCVAIRS